jgi:hypothetical protein
MNSKTMKEELLREISEKYLLPFFSGATLENISLPSKPSDSTVAFISPQVIGFKVNKTDTYRLQFRRNQPFAQKDDSARETRVIEAFVAVLERMSNALRGPHKEDLLSSFQRHVVAHAVAESGDEKRVLRVIDQMARWATRLYEGAPIASAIGIDPTDTSVSELTLDSIAENDFGVVLSNGYDTLLIFDKKLKFVGHAVMRSSESGSEKCPWRHSTIADWTNERTGRLAMVLNRLGEILVFRDGQLLFARRSGNWHFLTHGPILGQMVVPKDRNIRKALYETALDASFARTGACLGIVSSGAGDKWKKSVAESDRLDLGISVKSKTIATIISGRKFHDLERTLRQELVAIDGATVIDYKGEVLAVGAILKIDAGSTGGGRTAAAKTLSGFGLGIKISQDGAITAYRPEAGKKKGGKVAFKVM